MISLLAVVYAGSEAYSQTVINPGLTLQELVYDSDVIVYGRVLKKESRWVTDHMIMTDYEVLIIDTIFEDIGSTFLVHDTYVLRLAGGIVGDTGLEVGHIPLFDTGDELVLFLDQENRHAISPLVGVYQGYMKVEQLNGRSAVVDHRAVSVKTGGSGENEFPDTPSFLGALKQDISHIKSNKEYDWRGRINEGTGHSDPRRVPVSVPVPDHRLLHGKPVSDRNISQVRSDSINTPHISHLKGPDLNSEIAEPTAVGGYVDLFADKYYFGLDPPDLPFVWNITPQLYDNGAPWGINFEYACSDWNRYASHIFVKLSNGTFRMGANGTNDVLFLTPSLYQNVYFGEWPANAIAGAKRYFNIQTNQIYEVDIIFNAEKQWTVDFETAYNSDDTYYFRSVAIHELGHAFGMNHPWEGSFDQSSNSVLAYQGDNKIRTLISRPHGMDARAVRSAYNQISNQINDYGVYLYHTTPGVGNMFWSSFPDNVVQGNTFTVENVVVENLGTVFELRGVSFYLSTHKHTLSGSTNHFLGLRLVSVGLNQYNKYDFTFTVPHSVPFGYYYILADMGSDDHDFNRYAWSEKRILVFSAPSVSITPAIQDFSQVATGECSGLITFTLTNNGGGTATGEISLTGTDAGAFTIVSGGGSFSLLGGGQQRSIEVRFCPSSEGLKSATLQISGSGNTNDASASLSGNGCILPATPGPILGNGQICSGSSEKFNIEPARGATSYLWQYGGEGNISGSGRAIELVPISGGTLRVRAQNSCGNSTWQTKNIVVQHAPEEAGPISGPDEVVSGRIYEYNISAVKNAASYSWSYSGMGSFTDMAGSSVSIEIVTSGTLSVSVINSCGSVDAHPLQIIADNTPIDLNAGTTDILRNESACFGAVRFLTLAEDKKQFLVHSGGSATLIAGQGIRMLPGTHLMAGSQVHARIAPGGPFCREPDKQMVTVEAEAEVEANQNEVTNERAGSLLQADRLFRVYPNPTPGRFTLELAESHENEKTRVDIFGLRGERILSEELPGDLTHHELSLEGRVPGIYIVRVISGHNTNTVRLLKK